MYRLALQCCLLAFLYGFFTAKACAISVQVLASDNKPVVDAVVYAVLADNMLADKPVSAAPLPVAVMDQQNKTFIPHVLAVPVGTRVSFPNTDSVNHYVYSFSDIKKFQFKLFKNDPEKHQVLFDKPGIATMGCNIHDFMLGYIFVAPSPYVAVTDTKGYVQLNLPERPGFSLEVWHERANEDLRKLALPLMQGAGDQRVVIHFTKALKPERKLSHDSDDY